MKTAIILLAGALLIAGCSGTKNSIKREHVTDTTIIRVTPKTIDIPSPDIRERFESYWMPDTADFYKAYFEGSKTDTTPTGVRKIRVRLHPADGTTTVDIEQPPVRYDYPETTVTRYRTSELSDSTTIFEQKGWSLQEYLIAIMIIAGLIGVVVVVIKWGR